MNSPLRGSLLHSRFQSHHATLGGGALRDDTKNGCVADYLRGGTCTASRSMHILMRIFVTPRWEEFATFVLSLQDALKFTLIKLTITRNSPYSLLDLEACLGFQNIEDAKIACGDRCHPRQK